MNVVLGYNRGIEETINILNGILSDIECGIMFKWNYLYITPPLVKSICVGSLYMWYISFFQFSFVE